MRRLVLLCCLVAGLGACRSAAPTPAEGAAPPPPAHPLEGLAGQRIVVPPVQYLRGIDSLGWAAQIRDPRAWLRSLDDEITFALGERGLRQQWALPHEVERTARRNAAYVADPHELAAEYLRAPNLKLDAQLRDPLASQLRSLVALEDARFVLLPLEVRFEKVGSEGAAVLRLALIDARAARVDWMGDVPGDTSATLSPAVPASLASHLADLIAAP